MLRFLLACIFAVTCHVCAFLLPFPWSRDIPPALIGEESITVSLSASIAAGATVNVSGQGAQQMEFRPPDEQVEPIESRTVVESKPLAAQKIVSEAGQHILNNVERVVLKQHTVKRKHKPEKLGPVAPPKTENSTVAQAGSSAISKKTEDISPSDSAQSNVEARPMYHINPKPVYPELARRRGWQGTVFLAVMVSAEGVSEKVSIVTSCGFDILDTSALKAVQGWRFLPGIKRGTPAAMKVLVPVHFVLEQ